jgi:tetratricopeptide (TPR) repeat protein
MERKIETKDILLHMEVPSLPGVFVLGCFERRITFYSQQVRALNLIHALSDQGRLSRDARVLVIGAGAAGLTAAAAAGRLGARVQVFEQDDEVMPLLRGNHTRWLHPHIYDWPQPGSEDPQAGLPLLDWHANMAGEVVRQLERQWTEMLRESNIRFQGGIRDLLRISGRGIEHDFTWNEKLESSPYDFRFNKGSFDLVIVAVGFGRERVMQEVESSSYWADDDLHQRSREPTRLRRYLVSGTGDGGLVDLLRIRLRDFRHDHLVKEFLSAEQLEPLRQQLCAIEEDADGLPLGELYERYENLRAPSVDAALNARRRLDTSVVLNGREPYPLSPRACVLNRFLVSRLLRMGVSYKAGRVKVSNISQKTFKVSFDSKESEEEFDRLIIRHGPEGALTPLHSWLNEQDLVKMRERNQLDQTRVPLWPPDFLSVGHTTAAVARGQTPPSPPPRGLPPPPHTFGREELTRQLVERLLASPPLPTVVLGPPGVGKSTLTLSALHHPGIERRYAAHRYFLRLDGVSKASGLNSDIAHTCGLTPGPGLPARLDAFLGGEPALLVLDNAETPWEADGPATETLLAELSNIPRLAVLLSVRGKVPPPLPRMGRPLLVPLLELAAARELFLGIAYEVEPQDPRLDEMLKAQEGLPLAVTLLAHSAQGVDLDWTYKQWRNMRGELLDRKDRQDRQGSLSVSFELSLQSPRVGLKDRRLLSMLCGLPAGIALDDLERIFPEGLDAPAVLQKMALAFVEKKRLRVLAPLREYMRRKHPLTPDDWARVATYYSTLAREWGPRVGTAHGAIALTRLAEEAANLEEVLLDGLRLGTPREAIDSVLGLNNFMRFSGYGSIELLERAREQARHLGDEARDVQCTYTLGQLLLRRSRHERALPLFQEALSVFERFADVGGQARCLQSLGSLALDDMDWETARNCFERAIPFRQQMQDARGTGNCLHGLGKASLGRGLLEEARGYFNEALALFEENDQDLGRAHCLRSLGELDTNVHQLDRARGLFEKAGDVRGMGHCLRGMGDIALRDEQWPRADSYYQQARRLLQQVGSVRGVANCLLGQGDVAKANGGDDKARAAFQQALELYRQVRDKAHEEDCLQRLASR